MPPSSESLEKPPYEAKNPEDLITLTHHEVKMLSQLLQEMKFKMEGQGLIWMEVERPGWMVTKVTLRSPGSLN
jgi:hypothetical protein